MITFKHERFHLEVLWNARTASDMVGLFSRPPHIMGVECHSQVSLAGTSSPKFKIRQFQIESHAESILHHSYLFHDIN